MKLRYLQKWIRIGDPDTNNKNIQPEFRNGIWHRKVFHADNEKWEKRRNGRNWTAIAGKDQNAQGKRKWQVLGNIGSEYYQANTD